MFILCFSTIIEILCIIIVLCLFANVKSKERDTLRWISRVFLNSFFKFFNCILGWKSKNRNKQNLHLQNSNLFDKQ